MGILHELFIRERQIQTIADRQSIPISVDFVVISGYTLYPIIPQMNAMVMQTHGFLVNKVLRVLDKNSSKYVI